MKKIMATLVALSMMIVTVPAAADAGDRATAQDERLEMMDDMETLDEVSLASFMGSIQGDLLAMPMDSLVGNDAGCSADGADSSEWAAAGTPDAPCDFEAHSFGITHTSVSCTDACFIDAVDWATLSFLSVSCEAGSSALIDWAEGTITPIQGSCEAGVAGDPTSFSDWDSLGNGDWTHADNPGDALYHLLL